jgi:hypothetical protein
MNLIDVKRKPHRTDPLAYLLLADQLDDLGEDGAQTRRAGYLLQAVLDLILPVQDVMRWGIAEGPARRFPRQLKLSGGDYRSYEEDTDDYRIVALFRRASIDLFLWKKPVEKGSAVRATLRSSCLTRGELRGEESGVEYLVRRTLALLASLDGSEDRVRRPDWHTDTLRGSAGSMMRTWGILGPLRVPLSLASTQDGLRLFWRGSVLTRWWWSAGRRVRRSGRGRG